MQRCGSPSQIRVSELSVDPFLSLSHSSLWACCGPLASSSQIRVSELAVDPFPSLSTSSLWACCGPLASSSQIQVSELAVDLFLSFSNSSLWADCPLPLKFESLSLLWTVSSPSQIRVSELDVASSSLSLLNSSL
jgi:hypothetical protein